MACCVPNLKFDLLRKNLDDTSAKLHANGVRAIRHNYKQKKIKAGPPKIASTIKKIKSSKIKIKLKAIRDLEMRIYGTDVHFFSVN